MIISTWTTILRLKRHDLQAVADQNTHRQTLVNLSGGYPTLVSNWVNKGQLQCQRAVESERAKFLATQTFKRQRTQSTKEVWPWPELLSLVSGPVHWAWEKPEDGGPWVSWLHPTLPSPMWVPDSWTSLGLFLQPATVDLDVIPILESSCRFQTSQEWR